MAKRERGIYSKHAGIILEVPIEKETKMFLTGLTALIGALTTGIGGLITAISSLFIAETIFSIAIHKIEDWGGLSRGEEDDDDDTIDGDDFGEEENEFYS